MSTSRRELAAVYDLRARPSRTLPRMDSVWIGLTAVGTLALVAVGVWQIRSSRTEARRREEREAQARRVAVKRQEREKQAAQERAEHEKAPALSVREAGGFNGREREVEI